MASEWLRNLRHCYDKRKEDKLACECRFRRCEDKGDETAWITLLMFAKRSFSRAIDFSDRATKRGKLRNFEVRWETPVSSGGTFKDYMVDCMNFQCGDQVECDGWIYQLTNESATVPAEELSLIDGCAVRLFTERLREVV